jgi:hypothetical protein
VVEFNDLDEEFLLSSDENDQIEVKQETHRCDCYHGGYVAHFAVVKIFHKLNIAIQIDNAQLYDIIAKKSLSFKEKADIGVDTLLIDEGKKSGRA